MDRPEMLLRVPGSPEYVLAIRMLLGGAAALMDLSVAALDDLRIAADEACDCLLHQGRAVESLEVRVSGEGKQMTVVLTAEFAPGARQETEKWRERAELCQGILEALVPQVRLSVEPGTGVRQIVLTVPRAA